MDNFTNKRVCKFTDKYYFDNLCVNKIHYRKAEDKLTELKSPKPKRPARTQEERRQATIAALMSATIEALIDIGYTALTMAEVAKRAGVSRGALNHYYGTKEKLVIAATHNAMATEMAQIDTSVSQTSTRKQAIDAFFNASERFYLSRGFIAQLELVLAARNDSRIAEEYYPLIVEYRRLFDSNWQEALTRAGMPPKEALLLINMTNSMLRGVGLATAILPIGQEAKTNFPAFRKKLHQLFDAES